MSTTSSIPLIDLTIGELISLHEAQVFVAEALGALSNKPLNQGKVESILDAQWEACLTLRDTIEDEIESRKCEGNDRLARLSFLAKINIGYENYERAAHFSMQALAQNAADWAALEAKYLPARTVAAA